MRIGHHDTADKILIVAEIGNNHEGNFEVARELVRRAASCGVDAVKFQTFQTRLFTSTRDEARYRRLSSFELSYAQFEELERLARSLGLVFFSTPLDLESARFLRPLVDCFKVASGDNDFFALISLCASTGKPLIISSGLADLSHLKRVVGLVRDEWRQRGISQELAVLHCVTSYPVPPAEANLAAIPLLAQELGCTIGYSDHTAGTDAALAAAALGARILEKHFTLDRHFSDFRDHQLSADPDEMKRIVEGVRRIETLLGKREKVPQPSETPNVRLARRSIVAATDLRKGQRLAPSDLTWMRPAVGLAPGAEGQVIGKVLKRDLQFGEPILPSDLE